MASLWTNKGKADLMTVGTTGITLRAMLVDADQDTAANADLNTLSEVTTDEIVAAGRKTLTTVTVTEDDTNDRAVLDCDDLVWTAANFGTIGGVWIFRRVGGADAGTDPLWFYIDVNPNLVTNGGDITLSTPNGITRLT